MNLLDVPPAVLEERLEVGDRAYVSYESHKSENVIDVCGELLELDERTIRIHEHKGRRSRDLLADLAEPGVLSLAYDPPRLLGPLTYVGKSPRKARVSYLSSAGRYLCETDPEDFPPDEEVELVTDGGIEESGRERFARAMVWGVGWTMAAVLSRWVDPKYVALGGVLFLALAAGVHWYLHTAKDRDDVRTDGGRRLADKREALRQELDGRETIKCGLCEETLDLSSADDGDEAVEVWDEHVRNVHDQEPDVDVGVEDGGAGQELGFFVIYPRLDPDRVDPLLAAIARAGFDVGERNDGGAAELVSNALGGDSSSLDFWAVEDRPELVEPARRLWEAQSLLELVARSGETSEVDARVLRECISELNRIEEDVRDGRRPRTDGGVDVDGTDQDPDADELRRQIGRLEVTIHRLKRERDEKLDRLDELENPVFPPHDRHGGEDLETDGGEDLVEACPECDSPSIRRRYFRQGEDGLEPLDDSERWVCDAEDCGETFAEPNRRPPLRSPPVRSPLEDLDPDDVPITDGGRPSITVDHLIDVCEAVDPGDEVDLAIAGTDYKNPLVVDDVTVVRWLGGGWRTARLVLEGARGGEHAIIGVEGEAEPRDHASGSTFRVYQLDPVGVALDVESGDGDQELDPLGDGDRRPWSTLGVDIPAGLSREDLEAAVDASDRLYGVCDELGLDPEDRGLVRVLTTNEGLYERLSNPEGRRARPEKEADLATDGGTSTSEREQPFRDHGHDNNSGYHRWSCTRCGTHFQMREDPEACPAGCDLDTARDHDDVRTDGGADQEPDVSVHLDDETTIDPAGAFKRMAECPHPPAAVEPFSRAPEGVGEPPDGYICGECGHVLTDEEVEDRGIREYPGGGSNGGIR